MLPTGNRGRLTNLAPERVPGWANCSERRRGCDCGANAASITRHTLARRQSFGGLLTNPVTCCASGRAALNAAAEVRRSSISDGAVMMSAFCRFRCNASTERFARRLEGGKR